MAGNKQTRVPKPRSGRPGERRPLGPGRPGLSSLWYVLGFILLLAIVQAYFFASPATVIPYSQFKDLVAQDKVSDVTISEQTIRGKMKGLEPFTTTRPGVDDPKLLEDLQARHVKYTGEVGGRWLPDLLSWIRRCCSSSPSRASSCGAWEAPRAA